MDYRQADSGNVLQLVGELSFDSVPGLLNRLAKENLDKIAVIDVSELSKVDSAGVACLLSIRNRWRGDENLQLRNASSQLRSLIDVTGVGEILMTD